MTIKYLIIAKIAEIQKDRNTSSFKMPQCKLEVVTQYSKLLGLTDFETRFDIKVALI